MTPAMLDLSGERQKAVAELVATWWVRRGEDEERTAPTVAVQGAEVVVAGRPGLLDVVAEVDGRSVHAVLGLRRPGEEVRLLRSGDDPVVGVLDDDDGLAVVVDALRDADLAPLVLRAVTGTGDYPGPVSPTSDDGEEVVLTFGDRCSLTVFTTLCPGPRPAVTLLVALDEVGFNHLAAPIALWRRGGQDLGMAQELLAGSAEGSALARTSLRDLLASPGPPEVAGGDFAPEARALGTMTARMHLALDRAFGREPQTVAAWAEEVRSEVGRAEPSLLEVEGVAETLSALGSTELRAPALCTHGDFGLGRTARTDHGWVVADWRPGGVPPGATGRLHRSPLEDVADFLWSLHREAVEAAAEREASERATLAPLARAWEERNRRAFLRGYVATPGIGGLIPADRDVLRQLVAAFELERAARSAPTAFP